MRKGFCLEWGMTMMVTEVKLLLKKALNLLIYPRSSTCSPPAPESACLFLS